MSNKHLRICGTWGKRRFLLFSCHERFSVAVHIYDLRNAVTYWRLRRWWWLEKHNIKNFRDYEIWGKIAFIYHRAVFLFQDFDHTDCALIICKTISFSMVLIFKSTFHFVNETQYWLGLLKCNVKQFSLWAAKADFLNNKPIILITICLVNSQHVLILWETL